MFVLLQPKRIRRNVMNVLAIIFEAVCSAAAKITSLLEIPFKKLWRFNKKHHCITYDGNSIDSLYDWDDDDDF